ncbi:2-hydroxyacid dehydrogenase [Tistrella mobilis]|uniref:2-hydroxyacid dehydrogenase n=1 Tax=Tistrella mobilis TaxID=171437 RepID=UPI003557D587
MPKLILIGGILDLGFMKAPLLAADPRLDITVWPEDDGAEAEIAVCWRPPAGLLGTMPKLKLVQSIAAGVDGVLNDAGLDPALPVARIVDDSLPAAMSEFVLWSVLWFHRGLDQVVLRDRPAIIWQRPPQQAAADRRIGVLGLGEIGGRVARALSAQGFAVAGWSRSPRSLPGIAGHHGPEGLDALLAESEILVNLLPLTPRTRGILGAATFAKLPRGAAVINVGRGEHLVPEDLIAALDSGHLRGAVLDVFAAEPLDPAHPLWTHPRVLVTPHMAAIASDGAVIGQIVENAWRVACGRPPLNPVERGRGY